MRIRSTLAAVVLAVGLTAAGAATAAADGDEPIPCSPYSGSIHTETAELEYQGALCHKGVFDN
ncbi:hypothetical protein ACIF8T_03135 [Streptomyces sp. NPDC085946]|uniref:hypothetical protein n=1 Tax=Streptomyces sp. NPDC085946 TaxID=3365744 RepID=UPI0037CCE1EB